MPRRSSKATRNGAKKSTGTESLRLAIKGTSSEHIFDIKSNRCLSLDFNVYEYSRSTKDSPQNNLRTTSKLTRECKVTCLSRRHSLIVHFFQGKKLLDEQDWYEKDLSDFDDPQLSDEEPESMRFLIF